MRPVLVRPTFGIWGRRFSGSLVAGSRTSLSSILNRGLVGRGLMDPASPDLSRGLVGRMPCAARLPLRDLLRRDVSGRFATFLGDLLRGENGRLLLLSACLRIGELSEYMAYGASVSATATITRGLAVLGRLPEGTRVCRCDRCPSGSSCSILPPSHAE